MALPAVPAQPGAVQNIAMDMRYGPNAGAALARSQYLAEALQSMESSARQNIRTPTALWSNLLAAAIMQGGKENADKAAMAAYQKDSDNHLANLLRGLPTGDGASPAAPPEPPPAPPLAASLGSGNPAPQATPQSTAPAISDPDKQLLARMVYGEARGEPARGQEAVAAVALNRARKSGQSLADVLMAPHQFAGLGPTAMAATPDQLAPILANIAPALQGQDPTNGADHFYNPQLASPSWGNGPGQMIGAHKFMALNGGPSAAPPQAMAQNVPPPQAPPGAPGGMPPAGQNGPAPYQIAANGPTPPAPQSNAPQGQPSVPPSPPPTPQGPAPAPLPSPGGAGAPAGPPTMLVTPQQVEYARQLYADPRTRDQGEAMLIELHQKMLSQPDPSKPYWGADGRAHYAPGTESTITPGALPGSYWVKSPQNDLKNVAEGNLNNAPPPGYDRDPANPQHLILQGSGAPPPASGGQPPPGKAPIPPALQKPYMDTLDAWHKAPGYTDYANSVNAVNALEQNLKAAAGNNGVISQATTDNLIRAMTGLSARQGSVTSMLDHLPWSDQLKGFIAKAIGPQGMNGFITPTVIQQMRSAVHAYAEGHRRLAEDEYNQFNAGANRMGFDLGQQLPTIESAGPIKWLDDNQPKPPSHDPDPIIQTRLGPMRRSQLQAIAAGAK